MGRAFVAGEDDIEIAFLVVHPVNQIEEQLCILFIELTVAYLINNQAGRAHQAAENGCSLSSPLRCGGLVHLNEAGLNIPLATLAAECLNQMGLADSKHQRMPGAYMRKKPTKPAAFCAWLHLDLL